MSQANPSKWNEITESLSAFWVERNVRERNALILAITVITLTLIYVVLITPAWTGRTQLEKSLPVLRQQVAQLQALAKQATELASVNALPAVSTNKESIDATLKRSGIKPQSIVFNGDLIKIQLAATPFAAIVTWLDEMQKSSRLSVIDATFEAQGKVGDVNATMTLRRQSMDK